MDGSSHFYNAGDAVEEQGSVFVVPRGHVKGLNLEREGSSISHKPGRQRLQLGNLDKAVECLRSIEEVCVARNVGNFFPLSLELFWTDVLTQ